jgi:hypothetical protein
LLKKIKKKKKTVLTHDVRAIGDNDTMHVGARARLKTKEASLVLIKLYDVSILVLSLD